jgi:hypothetical protein
MSKPMNKTNEIKTLIVTETLRYEFTVPAAMAENEVSLRRFFTRQRNPWSEADFAAVIDRDFEIDVQPFECGSFTESETARPLAVR